MTQATLDSSLSIDSITTVSVVKRNGMLVPFRRDRITNALEAAFRDTKKISKTDSLPSDIYRSIQAVADLVVEEALRLSQQGATLSVEGIQDLVEQKLIETNHIDVARDYIIYRDHHKSLRDDSPRNLKILRSDGVSYVRFNPIKISESLEFAFREALNIHGRMPDQIINAVNQLTNKAVESAMNAAKLGQVVSVEFIQDELEKHLMATGFYKVAKHFILIRALRQKASTSTTEEEKLQAQEIPTKSFHVLASNGTSYTLNDIMLKMRIAYACKGLENLVSADAILESTISQFYEGIKESEVDLSLTMATRTKIETEPAYSKVAARLLLDEIYRETIGVLASDKNLKEKHEKHFKEYIQFAVKVERLSPVLLEFDLDALAKAMKLERDLQFEYLGIQTLYDRYFIHHQQKRLETPQYFWMRVAMGLSINEGKERTSRAIEFYNILSSFLFVSSTPTLFNAGTKHSQLSSCYLSTVMDDLENIFKVVADDAQLSKWAGGIGNDWTNVRATGAVIKGTNGHSQGVIPFLKVANDTAVAVNQGGKRKGAMCAYLETWHLDIEDFLEMRKNTGDERRRTHDMNTANWIPDLFMKRVIQNAHWTLFSPSDAPDLHDLYGSAFEKRYIEYEKMVDEGKIKLFKRIEAVQLWRKMLGMLFETGHPWITFKDPSNIRSPQDHVGVVHSSNLCTEILLNTSKDETAVCNLGSVNLAFHCTSSGLNKELLASTIRTAVRMLDNVIDINFYPTKEAKTANIRHRPIGLGLMGFQDALYIQNISYASHQAVQFADESMEMISYYAILASSELAVERGTYSSYTGSKWDRGLLPIDTIDLLEQERGVSLEMDKSSTMDWDVVRAHIKKHGMRNSNTMAIAPTATISNITGVTQSIEPMYKHLFVKSNLSGEFTIPSIYLVNALKKINLWDEEMLDDLKYFDGSILEIERIPESIKSIYLTAFEIEPEWLIECASRRQKWIDMGQSLNLYLSEPSGKKLHNMYLYSWKKGLKTNYYLRSLGATQIEKSTTDINKRGLQPRWMKNKSASSNITVERDVQSKPTTQACTLGEACESCQ
ncbi:MAG: ribonucleoside-diphosphate reductase subunit alpha [Chlamydiales bacterium]|nr:ribonucleoside-diphosphate reductase subunit alpha [Chlamydiales bacterium]